MQISDTVQYWRQQFCYLMATILNSGEPSRRVKVVKLTVFNDDNHAPPTFLCGHSKLALVFVMDRADHVSKIRKSSGSHTGNYGATR